MYRRIAVVILMIIIVSETVLIYNLLSRVKNELDIREILEDNFSRKTKEADLEIDVLRAKISEDTGKLNTKDQTIRNLQEELIALKERAKEEER